MVFHNTSTGEKSLNSRGTPMQSTLQRGQKTKTNANQKTQKKKVKGLRLIRGAPG